MSKQPTHVQNLIGLLKNSAEREMATQVQRVLPPSMRVAPETLLARTAHPNPSPSADEDENEDEDEDDGAGEGPVACYFDYPDADRNLACAAAAYRAAGAGPEYDDDDECIEDGDIVAQHEDGRAFFGSVAQMQEHIDRTSTRPEDWSVWDEPGEILALDYDTDGVVRMIRLMDETEDSFTVAQKEYEKFHWGDESNAIGMVEVPGVTGAMAALGITRKLKSGGRDNGKWQNGTVDYGQLGQAPTVYGAGPLEGGCYKTLIISGGAAWLAAPADSAASGHNAPSRAQIPGVTGRATPLGLAREIEYGAKKQGKWEEYYHIFGEESGTYPTIYGLGDPDGNGRYRALAISGGGMHVEDRGIVD